MDLLVNLLETDDIKCKIGTLRIVREITKSTQPAMAIIDLGGNKANMDDPLCISNKNWAISY